MDAYNVAFRIPNLLRDLFAEGAMSAAFVPTFTTSADHVRQGVGLAARQSRRQRADRGHRRAGRARHRLRGAARFCAFAGREVHVRPEKLALTVQMARIMLPALTLIALAAAFMGMLNSLHHYFIPALSPAMFNVADDRLRVRAGAADAGVRPRRRSWRSRSARCSAASRSWRCSGRRCIAKDSAIASTLDWQRRGPAPRCSR